MRLEYLSLNQISLVVLAASRFLEPPLLPHLYRLLEAHKAQTRTKSFHTEH